MATTYNNTPSLSRPSIMFLYSCGIVVSLELLQRCQTIVLFVLLQPVSIINTTIFVNFLLSQGSCQALWFCVRKVRLLFSPFQTMSAEQKWNWMTSPWLHWMFCFHEHIFFQLRSKRCPRMFWTNGRMKWLLPRCNLFALFRTSHSN